MTSNREIHLASRPDGWPTEDDFRLVETDVPTPGPGQIVVRNQYMSVDPYMRGRMNDVKSYVPPFALDAPLDGGAIGEVVASEAADDRRRDHRPARAGLAGVRAARRHRRPPGRPEHRPGQRVPGRARHDRADRVRRAARGGRDEARRDGLRLRRGRRGGQPGRPDRQAQGRRPGGRQRRLAGQGRAAAGARLRRRLRLPRRPVRESLRAAAPDGIDVYFDNVGGDHLEAAISAMNLHGRVAICGMISQYNATEPPAAPRNLALVIGKRLTLRGFLVSDHNDLRTAFVADVARLAARRHAVLRRDDRGRHRERPGRVPRPAARRQPRQDARQGVTQTSCAAADPIGSAAVAGAEDRLAA